MTNSDTLIARIQAQLTSSARQNFTALSVPPFTVYINTDSDSPWNNYAIPDEPGTGELQDALDRLCEVFRQQQRQPRFEFIAEFAPPLVDALRLYGFVEEMHTQLMVCTPTTFQRRATNPVADTSYTFERLDHKGALTAFQEFMQVQQEAFGEEAGNTVDAMAAEQFRRRFATTQFYALRRPSSGAGSDTASERGLADDREAEQVPAVEPMVCVASLLPAYDGLTEIAGIATAQAYRRQGFATALITCVVAEAFAQGLTGVFLTAADATAGRVYERVGFHAIGTGLAYQLPNQR